MFKIESIQRVTLNGSAVKLFKAFKLIDGAYIYVGQFSAPARTANKNLASFIGHDD